MSALKKPSATVGMKKGLDTTQDEPAGRAPFSEDLKEFSAAMKASRPPKPIRVTLDLDEHRHAVLKASKMTAADLLRALIDQWETDPDLRARIWAAKR